MQAKDNRTRSRHLGVSLTNTIIENPPRVFVKWSDYEKLFLEITSNETIADPYAAYRSFKEKEHRLAHDNNQSSEEARFRCLFQMFDEMSGCDVVVWLRLITQIWTSLQLAPIYRPDVIARHFVESMKVQTDWKIVFALMRDMHRLAQLDLQFTAQFFVVGLWEVLEALLRTNPTAKMCLYTDNLVDLGSLYLQKEGKENMMTELGLLDYRDLVEMAENRAIFEEAGWLLVKLFLIHLESSCDKIPREYVLRLWKCGMTVSWDNMVFRLKQNFSKLCIFLAMNHDMGVATAQLSEGLIEIGMVNVDAFDGTEQHLNKLFELIDETEPDYEDVKG